MGPERSILLLDVRLVTTGEVVTDHLWFTYGASLARLELQPGDRIQFDARVGRFIKSYQGRRAEELGEAWSELDYRLERSTKVCKLVDDMVAPSNELPPTSPQGVPAAISRSPRDPVAVGFTPPVATAVAAML
ncbi:hypothetical protein Afer_1649 [Acidimicrobium ferrooxidans DSM 10331]|uniref:Uncharacterized protein n=1 Tax=Acidimicrobium ferrooxidans (strain DSM 10331 / JCM 15462 / NBRC 103882 / ICP) TaxID=525909 RepID=C7M0Q7_ACIFD|nr:hypothetical protein [Acidimicrobium ferrooxidans]ACU54565.1 hypothetical protein Afer_1649 [Acidimicrobium ferrooxidans DSM 10331]